MEDHPLQKMLALDKGERALPQTRQAKSFVSGLGARVANYEKKHNLTNLGDTKGTPPGKRSIFHFIHVPTVINY